MVAEELSARQLAMGKANAIISQIGFFCSLQDICGHLLLRFSGLNGFFTRIKVRQMWSRYINREVREVYRMLQGQKSSDARGEFHT
jgi:hypothetical protein